MVPPPARYPTPRPRARPTPPNAQFGTPYFRTGASAQDDEGSHSAPTLVRESDDDSQTTYSDMPSLHSDSASDDNERHRVRGLPLGTCALFYAPRARPTRQRNQPHVPSAMGAASAHDAVMHHEQRDQPHLPSARLAALTHDALTPHLLNAMSAIFGTPVPLAQRNVGGTFQRHGQRNQLRTNNASPQGRTSATCSSQCWRPHTAPPVPLAQRNVGGTFQRHGQRNLLRFNNASPQGRTSATCSSQCRRPHTASPAPLAQRKSTATLIPICVSAYRQHISHDKTVSPPPILRQALGLQARHLLVKSGSPHPLGTSKLFPGWRKNKRTVDQQREGKRRPSQLAGRAWCRTTDYAPSLAALEGYWITSPSTAFLAPTRHVPHSPPKATRRLSRETDSQSNERALHARLKPEQAGGAAFQSRPPAGYFSPST